MTEQIKVWEFTDGHGDPRGYWAEGHVEEKAFLRGVERYWQRTASENCPDEFSKEQVKHVYCKQTPADPKQFDSDLAMDFSVGENEGEPMTIVSA